MIIMIIYDAQKIITNHKNHKKSAFPKKQHVLKKKIPQNATQKTYRGGYAHQRNIRRKRPR
jgi:hypothetical protein